MKRLELESLIDAFLGKCYSFCRCIAPNSQTAKDLLIDSYTNLLVKEKGFIIEEKLKDSEDRTFLKDYFFMRLMSEIASLGSIRSKTYALKEQAYKKQFVDFYMLDTDERMALFLNLKLNFSENQICEVLGLKRFEVIELLFFARKNLSKPRRGNEAINRA